ncbi:hypothetical protein HDU98_006809 [Podochytrium sp. JEL0797]|nr:hypothetical protein HDU98_006809 [Podochytrium sp. JEL0797]
MRKSLPQHASADSVADLAMERAWFTSRSRSGAVLITSANSGSLNYFKNMVCSLRTNAPDVVPHLIVWALDKDALEKLTELMLAVGRISFSIYYNPSQIFSNSHQPGGTGDYFAMMNSRSSFFSYLLSDIRIDFLFSDADVYYLSDPFTDPNLPFNISHPTPPATTYADIFTSPPDLTYSTDARAYYSLLADPFEGESRIPKICGGFFFARSTPATRKLWSIIHETSANDQWGVQALFHDQSVFDTILVDPLPLGISTRPATHPTASTTFPNSTTLLKVRILSQPSYRSALPAMDIPGPGGPETDRMTQVGRLSGGTGQYQRG